MKSEFLQGDVLERLQELPSNHYTGCLTDPPYGLRFMGKRWDSGVPGVEVWAELLRVLRPGAFVLAYGGTRTSHRLACAIEDAGFTIINTLAWAYGSGFPKGLDLPALADKAELGSNLFRSIWHGYKTPALKPAYEPIILAQRPIEGTFVNNCFKWGCGALNIGGCLIGTSGGTKNTVFPKTVTKNVYGDGLNGNKKHTETGAGRYPSNLIIDDEVAQELDEQSGVSKSGIAVGGKGNASSIYGTTMTKRKSADQGYGDTGGASRFFKIIYCPKASRKERDYGLYDLPNADTQTYGTIRTNRGNGYDETSKHRNNHPTVKPIKLNSYLATLIMPPLERSLIVPFAGVASEIIGGLQAGWSEVTGIEKEQAYIDIGERRIKAYG